MRICMVSTDYLPNPGGVAAHVYGLAHGLQANGHSVDIFTLAHDGCPAGTAVESGLAVTRVASSLPSDANRSSLSLAAGAVLRRLAEGVPYKYWRLSESSLGIPLWQLQRSKQHDVVHFHGLGSDATVSRWGGEAIKVFTNHTSMFISAVERGEGAIAWRQIEHADWFIAPSQELADLTVQVGADEHRVSNIPNGVDAETFRATDNVAYRAANGFRPDDIIVLTARRLVGKNGVRHLVRAAGEFLSADRRAHLVIAGDGPERQELEGMAAGIDDQRIHFLGNIERDAIPSLTNMADIVVLPSLKEATSIAGLEAMACAKVLVGTSVGGIPEIIADGETGMLVPPQDPASLAGAVGRLCADPALRARMGSAGRRRVEAEFSWEAVARRTVEVYEDAARRRSQKRTL